MALMRGLRRFALLLGLGCFACAPASPPPPAAAPAQPPPAAPLTAQVAAPAAPVVEPELPPLAPVPETLAGPLLLPKPPFAYTFVSAAPVQSSGRKLTLQRVQAIGNAITDVQEWFKQNSIALPSIKNRLPGDVPRSVGKAVLAEALTQPDGHLLLLYKVSGSTRIVAVVDPKEQLAGLFDFTEYGVAPVVLPGDESYVLQEVTWAAAASGVLYVGHHHRTYAKSSGGLNGYISAIDMAAGKLLWRSAPLVANSVNFVLVDGHIITGYGFTAEPDYIYVLDQATGRVESKLPIASQADYFVLRAGKLYVRSYDTNYVYDLRFTDK